MNETRQTIEDYVYYRNQMDMQKLFKKYDVDSRFINNCRLTQQYNNAPYQSYGNTYTNPNITRYSDNNNPWMFDINAMFPYYNKTVQKFTPVKPKLDLFKPLTKADDVQFKKFTGYDPNKLSFNNMVDFKLINPFTRMPMPGFEGKVKPVYNGFSTLPTHYTVTPELKRNITFRQAEIEGFRGYNSF